uniref:Uncharacterized protein n=1 Tax=Brassica oleracea TaxID=3712 RepID=A0A3P6FQD6_BRAOL|nr:unnamed protein product [Brassica oleracea]
MLPRHQGALVFISFIHLEQMGVKESGKHMFPLQFIQKKKPNLWVLGFSFKVPVPRFRIQVPDLWLFTLQGELREYLLSVGAGRASRSSSPKPI